MAYDILLETLVFAPDNLPGGGYIIDLGIGLVFFTALSFAVLGRRFEHKRSAAAVSAAMGLALSIGLVAWEIRSGYRLADLGTIAAGFGLVMIALVIYHAMRRVGGHWAGALTALGASLLIGQVVGLAGLNHWMNGVLVPLASLGLIAAGVMKLMMHPHAAGPTASTPSNPAVWRPSPKAARPSPAEVPEQTADPVREITEQVHAIDDVRRLSDRLEDHLAISQRDAQLLTAQPQLAALLRRQLAVMLPESQAVTRRLADLRAKAQMMRLGHLAKIRKLAPQVPRLPPQAARAASQQLRETYKEARLETRLDRLDRAAIQAEQRIASIVATVNHMLDAGRYDHAAHELHKAEKLGHQVQRLIKQIESDEKRVLALAVKATRQQVTQRDAA